MSMASPPILSRPRQRHLGAGHSRARGEGRDESPSVQDPGKGERRRRSVEVRGERPGRSVEGRGPRLRSVGAVVGPGRGLVALQRQTETKSRTNTKTKSKTFCRRKRLGTEAFVE